MLTYATLNDMKLVKQVRKIESAEGDEKFRFYLRAATRFIDRNTRRRFFPYYDTQTLPIPYKYIDLSVKQFPSADLYFHGDLLEPIKVMNSDGSELSRGYQSDYWLEPANKTPYAWASVNFPSYWGGYIQGANYRPSQPIISFEGIWGYHDEYHLGDAWIETLEFLEAPLDATTNTLVVQDAEGQDSWGILRFDPGYLLRIDNEFIEVVNVDPDTNTLTLRRGVNGSVKAEHEAGAEIFRWRVIEDIVEVCIQVAKTWREADTSAGSRIGVSDYSAGAELNIPNDPLAIISKYTRSIMGQQ